MTIVYVGECLLLFLYFLGDVTPTLYFHFGDERAVYYACDMHESKVAVAPGKVNVRTVCSHYYYSQ